MEILQYINEVWKPVRGYFGLYEVSNFGRVRSLKRGVRIIKPFSDRNGYQRVNLSVGNVIKHYFTHRLVWEAFKGPIHNGMQINHIDEDKTNNFIWVNPDGSVDLEKSNLSLVTPSENINWGTRNQKIERQVQQFDLNGNLVSTWKSIHQAQIELKYLRNGQISACCSGKLKTAHGFIWRYVD